MITCSESHTRKEKVGSIILIPIVVLFCLHFFDLSWTTDFFDIPVPNRGAAPTFGDLLVLILGFLVVGVLGLMNSALEANSVLVGLLGLISLLKSPKLTMQRPSIILGCAF